MHGYLGPETQQELVRKMYVLRAAIVYHEITRDIPGQAQLTKNLSKNLTLALSTLSNDADVPPGQQADTTTDPSNPPLSSIQLPPEIIDYVDSARNPDIYTREFVELVQRGNQDLKGKREAFAGFRDVLAREMRSAMPECRAEVDRVVAASASASADDQRDGAGPSQ